MNEETEKNRKKEIKIFVIRIVLFVLFGCVLPFIFIAWRYDIFRVEKEVSAKVSLTGWGFIAIVIAFFFFRYIYKTLKSIMPYSYAYQIINGVLKVILPLVLVYIVASGIAKSIELFKQALAITMICEIVAIFVNPFPKYLHDKGVEKTEDIMDLFVKKWKEKDE